METEEIEEIEEMTVVNRIPFPKWVERRKLIITGPPGCGKTIILNAIRGWPEEGYLNLASKDWWKAPTLAHRPREVHFGLPFVGFEKSVSVYDTDALDDSAYLEIDFFRILLLPPRTHPFSPDFRSKLIFKFILLPPEKTFALR